MTADVDDDIEYLYTENREEVVCQVCGFSLEPLVIEERESHYVAHFGEQDELAAQEPSSSGQRRGSPEIVVVSNAPAAKDADKPPSGDVFWHPFMGGPPPKNYSPGLIPVLKRILTRLSNEGSVKRAVLCFEWTTHIRGEGWDRMWTCGYDKEGAQQLKRKLFGTRKWIGTGDLHVALTYKGVPTWLIDFPQSAMSKGTASALTSWVVKYFSTPTGQLQSPASPTTSSVLDILRDPGSVTISSKMPLVLQHKGHSRLIVGYVTSKTGVTRLLMFDPARTMNDKVRKAGLAFHAQLTNPSAASSSSYTKQPQQQKLPKSFKKLLNVAKGSKRGRGSTASDAISIEEEDAQVAKRLKGGHESIVIDDDESEAPVVHSPVATSSRTQVVPREVEALDPQKTLDIFSVNLSKLSENDEYQILAFPLTDPWSPAERMQHRVVRATQVVKS